MLHGEGVAGEGSAVEGGLAEGEGEGLVDFVVGETLGFAGEGLLFGRDGERGEGRDGLPGTLVDEGAGSFGCALRSEKGHVRHGASCPPGRCEAEDEEDCGNGDGESAKSSHG